MENNAYEFTGAVNKTVMAANKEYLDQNSDVNSELQDLFLQPEAPLSAPAGQDLSKK